MDPVVAYEGGLTPSTRLLDLRTPTSHPLLRVTFGRTFALTARNVAWWPMLQWGMKEALDHRVDAGAQPYAYVSGSPSVEAGDSRGVIDYLVSTTAGGGTVRDLVNRLNQASPYTEVLRISATSVPTQSSGGATRADRERDEALDRARQEAEEDSFTGRIRGLLGSLAEGWKLPAAVLVVVLLLVLFIWRWKGK